MNALNRLDAHLQAARPGEDWRARRGSPATTRWAWARARRRWPTSASSSSSPSSCRRATPAPRWTTSTSTCWRASSATDAAVDAQTLAELERALMNQGFLDRGSDGQWRLSPKAMRQLGQTALRDVAQQLSGRHGERDTRRAGAAGELTGATRPWQFGDTEPWNVTRTLTNAVLRQAGTGRRRPSCGHEDHRRRRRDLRDRDAHAGRGGAAGRHVVLDGDGEPLAADEAHGAGAQPSGQHAVPFRCVADHRVRPLRPNRERRRADRAGGRLRAGHQPAPRAGAGRPASASPPQRPAGRARRHRRRADGAPGGLRRRRHRGVLRLPAAPADDRPHRAGLRRHRPAGRAGDDLPARQRPRAGPVHRPGRPAGRGPGRGSRSRRAGRRRGRRLSARAPAAVSGQLRWPCGSCA